MRLCLRTPDYCNLRCGIILFFTALLVLPSCKEDPLLWKVDSAQQVICDFIRSNPDEFSEFNLLVDIAGMKALLKIRGPYTVFLPTNDAMFDYYALKGGSGLEEFIEEVCRNHFKIFFDGEPTFEKVKWYGILGLR